MARDRAAPKLVRGGLAPWQAKLALQVLSQDLAAEIPVPTLAALCGLSRSHFARAFKASLGQAPHRWLMGERVRRAAEMLEQTAEPVSAIAQRCGFCDQSHFTRAFSAAMGESPAAWRRRRRAGAASVAAALVPLGWRPAGRGGPGQMRDAP